MEGQNYSVKERLEQLEALMGKYTAGGKDLCVAFSGGVDSSLILKAAVKAATKDGSKVYVENDDSIVDEQAAEGAQPETVAEASTEAPQDAQAALFGN